MSNPYNDEPLTYKQNMTKNEVFRVMKAIGLPLLVLALGIFTITNFAAFGTKLICPASGIMWIAGLITAILLPSQRKEVLNQTLIICAIYFLALLGFKMVLAIASGVSAEMIAASYDQAIPMASGNTALGFLQTAMWFTAFGVPIGQVVFIGKRLMQFRKTSSIQKAFGQKRNIRNSRNGNSSMF